MGEIRALVTGGCGFVGRHLTRKLIDKNADIWIIDDLSTGQDPSKWLDKDFMQVRKSGILTEYRRADQSIVFIRANALYVFLSEVDTTNHPSPDLQGISLPDFDLVFHLASIVGGRMIIDGDPLKVGIDLGIDAAMFMWASRPQRKPRIGRILYASSSAAYPIHLQSKETHVALQEPMISFDKNLGQPDMTYGWSKLTGEFLARLAASRYGLKVACIRPFSGYGEDQDLSYPVPAIARRIAKRENPVEVWGTGEQARDFVHIDDCVEAMFVLLDNVEDGSGVNVGSGAPTSFNQLIRVLSEIAGYDPDIRRLLDKPVGVQSRYANVEVLKSFGWQPKISLHEGMTRVLRAAEKRLADQDQTDPSR